MTNTAQAIRLPAREGRLAFAATSSGIGTVSGIGSARSGACSTSGTGVATVRFTVFNFPVSCSVTVTSRLMMLPLGEAT
jgi:hypothetical protein